MKTLNWSLIVLILVTAWTGCKKKENDETPVVQIENGSIFVTVVANGQLVEDAVVRTEPETFEITTDATGTAHIENIPSGIYQVVATRHNIGTGSSALAVEAGSVDNTTVQLIPGVFTGPMINIFSVAPQTAEMGDTVTVKAAVSDLFDGTENIDLEWSSDLDGVISTGTLDETGVAILNHPFETLGDRVLTLTATNSEGDFNSDQVTISIEVFPDPVVLEQPELVNLSVQLTWTQTDADNFVAYRVYREGESGFEPVEYISDINTTSYTDSEISIDMEYNYQVGIQLTNGYEILSNIITWQYGGSFIEVGVGLDMIKQDPTAPIIYGIDTESNMFVIMNTELDEVITSFYVGSNPTSMDFSLDNQLMYVANYGSTEITVVDLVSQSIQSSFFVNPNIGTGSGNPHTIAVLANGLLAYATSSTSAKVFVVDIESGESVFSTTDWYRYPFLAANSDGTKLFVGESETGFSELHRLNVSGNELNAIESSGQFGYPEPQVYITDNDEFVFYGSKKILGNNITSHLGSFDNSIYAINSDGTRALSEHYVFNANNYTIVSELPIPTKVSVFGNDDSSAYLFYEPSNRLYQVEIE